VIVVVVVVVVVVAAAAFLAINKTETQLGLSVKRHTYSYRQARDQPFYSILVMHCDDRDRVSCSSNRLATNLRTTRRSSKSLQLAAPPEYTRAHARTHTHTHSRTH
jgi:hypothetical protein